MKFEQRWRYPVAVTQLMTALTSRACYAARYHLDVHDAAAFELWQQTPAGLRLRIVKQVPIRVERLPLLLRSLVAPQMPLYVEFFWHDLQEGQTCQQARADLSLWLGKLPLIVEGRLTVSGQGEQSEQHLQAELISRLPLVSKKMLEKVLPRVEALLEEDQQALLAYLHASG